MVKPKLTTLEKLTIEYVDASVLRPNEYNPNRQSEEQYEMLKRSMEEDGFTQPVLALPDGRIIDGEHRWRASQEVYPGRPIPVVYVDMDEEQRRVSTLRHNLARGSHDVDLEGAILRDLEKLGAIDWAQQALGLDAVALDRMLNETLPIEEYGAEHEFGDSWEYDPLSEGTSQAALNAAHADQRRQMDDMARKEQDIVKRHTTMTRHQQETVQKAAESAGGSEADFLAAAAEAHVRAQDRAARGNWTTLTFVVPTEALKVIEDELDRLRAGAPNRNPDLTPELQRGLALEFMAVLSSQTPEESWA